MKEDGPSIRCTTMVDNPSARIGPAFVGSDIQTLERAACSR